MLLQSIAQGSYKVKAESLLKPGAKARLTHTGQIVELKRVSNHGISLVTFRTGGDYLVSNQFLVPLLSV